MTVSLAGFGVLTDTREVALRASSLTDVRPTTVNWGSIASVTRELVTKKHSAS
jgi:hypothetical protein